MFLAGVALGLGAGVALGLLLGHHLLMLGYRQLGVAIEKATYSIRFPSAPKAPVQVVLPSEQGFASSEEDQEQVPDWMSDDYVMER